jgi:hypothetical protein
VWLLAKHFIQLPPCFVWLARALTEMPQSPKLVNNHKTISNLPCW